MRLIKSEKTFDEDGEISKMYQMNESTGEIIRNEDYEGVNCLFEITLDASKANPEKANELLEQWRLWGTQPVQPE